MNNEEQKVNTFDNWCIVNLFGHSKIAGRVTEQVIAGQGFVRVDVPAVEDQQPFTSMFGPGAIYSIVPTTEEVVNAFVARSVSAPIQPYQLQLPQLPERVSHFRDDREEAPF